MLLAATPAVPPLLCTIEAVKSRWSPRPIPGVRVVKGQTFEVHRKGSLHVSPRYVIDSRLSVLADDLLAPEGDVGADGAISYRWSFQALIGPVATAVNQQPRDAKAVVEGDLSIGTDLRFNLRNRSSLVAIEQQTTPITRLDETASGRCHDQS
jgi:hypothetical protein